MKTNKLIKVMQITHDMSIGGLQKVVFDISTKIDKTKYEISVCCLRELGELAKELSKNNIKILQIPKNRAGRVDYLTFYKLYKILNGKNIDILHTHNTQPFTDGTIAGILARVPVIIHTDHAREYPDKKRYMIAEGVLSRLVNKVVAVSEDTKNKLIKYEKMNPNKITVIWNGINQERNIVNISKDGKKRELNVLGNYPIIGIGVRLAEQKGITYLLKAIARVVKDYPKLVLLIAGTGELEDQLKREVLELQLGTHVKFIGSRMDMPEILTVLDMYVLPSLWEGLPLGVLEAMGARLPIVASMVGGNKEAIIHNESGILVPPKNVDALANAIREVLGSPGLAMGLSNNAYARFNKHFTANKMVASYEKLYSYYHGKVKQKISSKSYGN